MRWPAAAVRGMAIMGVLGLAACTGSSGSGGEQPELGTVPQVRSPADIPSLPSNQYVLAEEDLRAYTQAQAVLSRRCMERFGMSWYSDATLLSDLPELTADPVRYFTVIDSDAAREHGYGSPEGGRQDQKGKSAASGYEPTTAERAVYDGTAKGATDTAGHPVGTGGCAAEVDRKMEQGGVEGIDVLAVGNEFHSLYGKAQQDSRVTEAFEKWSACMKEKGFRYSSPLDAANDPEWRSGADTKAAVAVATADVACKQKNNTVGIWYAVMAAYQTVYIDQKAEHFADILAHKKALLRNAALVVQGAE